MPNKAAAIKALRQAKKRTETNEIIKRNLKFLIKQTIKAVQAGDKDKALASALHVQQLADKAVKKDVLKRNTADRRKAAVMKKVNAIKK
jgi:small subunit ribosomal protein S20